MKLLAYRNNCDLAATLIFVLPEVFDNSFMRYSWFNLVRLMNLFT